MYAAELKTSKALTKGNKLMQNDRYKKTNLILFFAIIALTAIGNGMSDSVYANYFKEVYNVNAFMRGFIEFPRELPGILGTLIIAALSFLGDMSTVLLAQLLAAVGLTVLGLFTPSFGVMLIFLFINSMGMHLMLPLSDSIGMSLAEPDKIGKRVGQYTSVKSAFTFLAALCVFIFFRSGVFDFAKSIKLNFLIGAAAFIVGAIVSVILIKRTRKYKAPFPKSKRKFKIIFRKQYKYYYLLTVLNGVQKQIAYVYGSWVIIDLLGKKADTMALLIIISNFVCIFFMNMLGSMIDKFGVKNMMFVDALTFIIIYIIYGFAVWGVSSGVLMNTGWAVIFICVLFVLDRMSMQIGVVKSVYLRTIAMDVDEITTTLSTGTSLDHIVSIAAAAIGGMVWTYFGSQWVFFMAATFSIGNLIIAYKVNPQKEAEAAQEYRKQKQSLS